MSVWQSFDHLDQKKRSCKNWRNNKFQTLLNGFLRNFELASPNKPSLWMNNRQAEGQTLHKKTNSEKPNQSETFKNWRTKMAMDPTSVSLPPTSSPRFEYIFMYLGVLWRCTDMQESMMYNHPASANSAKRFEETPGQSLKISFRDHTLCKKGLWKDDLLITVS